MPTATAADVSVEITADASTRDRLLQAAEGLASTQGWTSMTMADVGAAAGVSRQTVYNEFGNKTALGEQVALRIAARLLSEVMAELARHDDLVEALANGISVALRRAEDEPLVRAVLTGARGDDEGMLPFLTTRAGPILVMATAAVASSVMERWPHLDPDEVRLLADAAVRLIVSHIVQPTCDPDLTGRQIAWMLTRAAGEVDRDVPPPT